MEKNVLELISYLKMVEEGGAPQRISLLISHTSDWKIVGRNGEEGGAPKDIPLFISHYVLIFS